MTISTEYAGRVIAALALELPEAVYTDVRAAFTSIVDERDRLRERLGMVAAAGVAAVKLATELVVEKYGHRQVCVQCEANARHNEAGGYKDLAAECRAYCRCGHKPPPKRPHINVDGEFQSDKYPTCPPGKVPLSVRDATAQDLLWEYVQRRRAVDAAFSDDLEFALTNAGYAPLKESPS